MAQPQKRYDGYGRPLPPLTDAREESLYEQSLNQQTRKMIAAQLETHYRALLRRGVYADVTLTLGIKNGVIMEEVRVSVGHTVRCEREDR